MKINKFTKVFIVLAFVSLPTISCLSIHRDRVCYQNQCFQVDLAKTPAEHARGLQGKEGLTDNEGMLFIFPTSSSYQFWMKDMKFPIDIIWLDYAQRVISIAPHVPPCLQEPCTVYAPTKEAVYVLEIKSGQAGRIGIKEGSRIEFYLK